MPIRESARHTRSILFGSPIDYPTPLHYLWASIGCSRYLFVGFMKQDIFSRQATRLPGSEYRPFYQPSQEKGCLPIEKHARLGVIFYMSQVLPGYSSLDLLASQIDWSCWDNYYDHRCSPPVLGSCPLVGRVYRFYS